MERIISSIDLSADIQWVIAIILFLLVVATTIFWIWKSIRPSKLVSEMQLRTRAWWGMCFIFLFASIVHPVVTYIGLATLTFFTLREVYTVLRLRESDRVAILMCYLSYFQISFYYNSILISFDWGF